VVCKTEIPHGSLVPDKQFYEVHASAADSVNQILQLEDDEISTLSK